MRVTGDELEEFFRELGQFTYYVQHIEWGVRQILMIDEVRRRGNIPAPPEEAAAIARIFENKTLGALMGRLEGVPSFPHPMLEALRSLNRERKHIIHHLAHAIGEFSTNPALRKTVVARLVAGHDLASAINPQLSRYIFEQAVKDGLEKDR
jgi:hypothetical protein